MRLASVEIAGRKIRCTRQTDAIAIAWSGRKRWFWPFWLWHAVVCSRMATLPVLWRVVRWLMYKTDKKEPSWRWLR